MPLSSSPSAARGRRIVCSALAALGGASACFGSSSCIGGPSRGYALYAAEGRRPDPSEVARLSGYVRFVDGRDVSSYGASFELLPGCHVIGTRSTWGSDVSGSATGMIVSTGTWTFALPMRAG
ncbi:MAG TPA: hypothetical protein VE987_19765, partial [Polyangiaceae bacterium]|nr:hypothetical protein [Polyangiaceae bacterium]